MKSIYYSLLWRLAGSSLLIYVLLLNPVSSKAIQSLNMVSPAALARLENLDDGDLARLADAGLEIYARLYNAQGELYLLLPADADLQVTLLRQGYELTVLDAPTSKEGYFLLYGLPEDLERVALAAPLLLFDERQAVVRVSDIGADELAALGVQSMPLRPRRLILPPKTTQAAAEGLAPDVIVPNPLIQEMVAKVSSSTLYTYNGNLSGEWAINIDGSPYTLATRYTMSVTPIKKATLYAKQFFESLGLQTIYDYYTINGIQKRSVLAQQVGLTQPDRIFMLIAHLDSISEYAYRETLAPGADDNASGSAGLMAIAEILRQYAFGCTLRYALFTGEEQGYYGSEAYAADVYTQGENLQAVLNIDMIAYNTPSTPATIELHTRPGNLQDLAIANLFSSAVSAYQLNLTPMILQDGKSFSDHEAFWEYNYPAIMAIEDWSDHTPFYHMTADRLSTLNMSYFTQFTKAALATFAHMGCLLEGRLEGVVSDGITGQPVAGALVESMALSGKIYTTTSVHDGSYSLILQPGEYTVTASANGYPPLAVADVQISHAQTTTLDFPFPLTIYMPIILSGGG